MKMKAEIDKESLEQESKRKGLKIKKQEPVASSIESKESEGKSEHSKFQIWSKQNIDLALTRRGIMLKRTSRANKRIIKIKKGKKRFQILGQLVSLRQTHIKMVSLFLHQ